MAPANSRSPALVCTSGRALFRGAALPTIQLSDLNRNTVNGLYRGLRERIPRACEAQRPAFVVVSPNP